jgi:hypothetical protein
LDGASVKIFARGKFHTGGVRQTMTKLLFAALYLLQPVLAQNKSARQCEIEKFCFTDVTLKRGERK